MKKHLLLLFLYPLFATFLHAQVTFVVNQVPAYTPLADTLFLAGSFNNWNPYDLNYHALRQQNGHYVFQLPASSGTIQFKITRGGWARVEGNASGGPLANRSFTFGNGQTVQLTVQSWEDLHGSAGSNTRTANVSILSVNFPIPQLNRTRRIWLYLPNDYFTANRSYPVLYMQDGQNLFDAATAFSGEWQVDESLRNLQMQGDSGVIVVGIDNGGANRLREYSPWVNPQYISVAEGDQYVDFLVHTLKPHIDSVYRTKADRLNTGIAGSSMGALIALYAAQREPTVFSKVGVFSPAFWFAGNNAYTYAASRTYQPNNRIYLICGGQESQSMVPDMARMRDTLLNKGYQPNELRYTVRQDGQHSEWFWRREFPAVYQWLFEPMLATNLPAPETNKTNFSLFPNPAHHSFNVRLLAGSSQLTIQSIEGKIVKKIAITGQEEATLQLETVGMQPGVYFITLNGVWGSATSKLLIQH